MTAYNGPVRGLEHEYIDVSPHNLNLVATAPNVFLHSGAGMDGLTVTSGDNILDGSTGSNFLIGGKVFEAPAQCGRSGFMAGEKEAKHLINHCPPTCSATGEQIAIFILDSPGSLDRSTDVW